MARILVYTTQLLNSGGIESHLQEFCRVMTSCGHQLDLMVPKCRLDNDRRKIFKSNVNSFHITHAKNKGYLFLWLLIKSTGLKRKRYDTLYTNGQGNTIWWIARLFKYKQWVHHHHTSGDDADLAMWSGDYHKAIMQCDTLVVCSELIRQRLSDQLQRPIICIPVFSRKLEFFAKKKDISGLAMRFGYFGRLIPEKGIDFFCRLSNEISISRISFHIWGTGSQEMIEQISQYKNLTYHGSFRDREELQEIVNNLDGFLLLSTHHEGLPVSLLEVMSAGVPWLSTDKGGIQELFVDKFSTRIIHSDSTYQEIKAAILQFAEDCQSGIIERHSLAMKYNDYYAVQVIERKWNSLMGHQLQIV